MTSRPYASARSCATSERWQAFGIALDAEQRGRAVVRQPRHDVVEIRLVDVA
jgi:hypothetical protein